MTVRRLLSGRWWRGVLTRDHVRLILAGVICFIALVVVAAVTGETFDFIVQINLSWAAFGLGYLLLTGIAFARTMPETTAAWAKHQQRVSRPWYIRWFVGEARGSLFIASVTGFAVIAAVLMIRTDGAGAGEVALGATGIVTSWLLMQTSYMLYYALAWHNDGGLELDGEPNPDMLDFAYVAFTIGTSFTVVDVRITDRRLRRTVLGHSLLSFAFNTVLLGLVVTFLAG